MSVEVKIGFAGLSHLGIIYSMATAAKGLPVVAFDEQPNLAESLAAGRFPVSEPGLDDAFRDHRQHIGYTADTDLLATCSLIFITLDVQTDDAGSSDLAALDALIDRVASIARPDAVLTLMSQVPPGFSRKLAARLSPGRKLYYQVETLVFGSALDRAVNPERYIVGCANPAEPFPEIYQSFLDAFACPVLPMRYESAELCKIAINCFLVSSVTTTNALAEVCEGIHADWSEIAPALRLDKRIGPHAYLKPGLGIAGGNLERDLVTVQRLASEQGCDARAVTAWQQNSVYMRDWVLRRLFRLGLLEHPDRTQLGVWGLAYKQDTHATKNSPSLALLRSLSTYRWQAYDPQAEIDSAAFPSVQVCESASDAARGTDALVVMTPWKEFAGVAMDRIAMQMRGRTVLDPYGILDGQACRKGALEYHCLGA